MSYAFERVNIGPLFIPGKTESDSEIEKITTKNLGKQFSFLNHKKLFTDYTIHPSISFNINILAGLVLKETIFYLLGKFEYSHTINREVFFTPLTYKVYFRDIPSDNVVRKIHRLCEFLNNDQSILDRDLETDIWHIL